MQSYVNIIISFFEDPKKILEQAVLDMNSDLIKVRQATAQVCNDFLFTFIFCVPGWLIFLFHFGFWILLLLNLKKGALLLFKGQV